MQRDHELEARATAAATRAGAERVGRVRVAGGSASALLDVTGLEAAAVARLEAEVRRALEAEPGIVAVRLVKTAESAPGSAQAARPRIVAVASGKGGVGKSTVAANLAMALARGGRRAGLLDADIHGPSVPTLFGVTGRATLAGERIQPIEAHGVRTLSMGMMTDPDRALAWRGPMASSAMAQMFESADWGDTEVLVIDMPPGTGDITLTLAQKVKPDGVVIVSTPQDLALVDARRALSLFRQLDVRVLGLVENMSMFTCPYCGGGSAVFGEGGVEKAAAAEGLPLLARLPLDPAIRANSDLGRPAPPEPFDALARAVLLLLEPAHAA